MEKATRKAININNEGTFNCDLLEQHPDDVVAQADAQ